MFGWAITFLIVALIAAVLGFGGLAGTAIVAAKLIFVVALVAFAISAVFGFRRRDPMIDGRARGGAAHARRRCGRSLKASRMTLSH